MRRDVTDHKEGMDAIWLGQMLRRNAHAARDNVALVDGELQLDYGTCHARCASLAGHLKDRGLRKNDRVAILSMNRLEYMDVCGACELSGMIAATVNYRLTAPEILALLRDSAPKALFFEAQYAEIVKDLVGKIDGLGLISCIDADLDWCEPYAPLLASETPDPHYLESVGDDIAYLVYTSGTTGKPKGCLLGQRELAWKASLHASDLGVTSDDRLLIVMPLYHVGARGALSAVQWRGATAHIHRSFDPAAFIRAVEQHRITLAHLAPTMIQMVLEHEDAKSADFSSLRAVLYSAAAMPLELLKVAMERMGNVFHQAYGQTEGIVSALQRHQHKPFGSERERRRLQSVGQPYPGVSVRLVDDDGNEVAAGEAGEIVYSGGSMFRGYWNDHANSFEAMREGWIHSGDIGRFDEDGFLYIVDRKKDMIVSGGENIYSREVEDALLRHPAVQEVAVIGVPDDKWGEAVNAVVSVHGGEAVSEAELIAFCGTNLASYKKPKAIHFVDALPKLANGKIDKLALRAQWAKNGI